MNSVFLAAVHVIEYPRFLNQGSNKWPLQWKYGVLTNGPQGKSQDVNLINKCSNITDGSSFFGSMYTEDI